MPVLFVGHGSPMNAIEDNAHTFAWRELGAMLPRPRAILCVSAHWLTEGAAVTAMEHPRTIHDFYGFPQALYKITYAAPGDAVLAHEIAALLDHAVALDSDWGLDHGTWSVLVHLYPNADIPVLQLSINAALAPAQHYAIGQQLAVLRDRGVLLFGSGNIVHNLREFRPGAASFSWATRFDAFVKERILARDHDALINFAQHSDAQRAHPTDEHYLPLLYVLGASDRSTPQFFNEEIVFGSISMRSVLFEENRQV